VGGTGPEERLQRAARILAMGAVRAAMRKQALLADGETLTAEEPEPELGGGQLTGSRLSAVGPTSSRGRRPGHAKTGPPAIAA